MNYSFDPSRVPGSRPPPQQHQQHTTVSQRGTKRKDSDDSSTRSPPGLHLDTGPVPYDDDDTFAGSPPEMPDTPDMPDMPGAPGNRRLACSPNFYGMLLLLVGRSQRNYPELCGNSAIGHSAAKRFADRLRTIGGARPGIGLPILDIQHPAVEAALRKVYDLLTPCESRSPVPEHPAQETDGAHTYLQFLAKQPAEEWFSNADLLDHFDYEGLPFRPADCLRDDVERGRVEKCCILGRNYYRLQPSYRSWLVEKASGVPWHVLFIGLKPLDVAADRSPSGKRNPPSPTVLQGMQEHLESRCGPESGNVCARSGPGLAQDFLAARGFRYTPLFTGGKPGSARQILDALNSQQHSRALICMPGQPAYFEAVKQAGVWWACDMCGNAQCNPPRLLADCLATGLQQQAANATGAPAGERARADVSVIVFSS